MRILTSPLADDLRRLRHAVAAAIERLRSLELPPGDPAVAGEVSGGLPPERTAVSP